LPATWSSGGSALKFAPFDADDRTMAAVPTLVFVGLALWTAVALVLAVVVGHALRRVQPIPVRVREHRVVDLRR
jgi:hypothetical protein